MVVCYCADRNLYPLLPTTLNSLLSNKQQVEKIYLLIEDNSIPYIKDNRVIFINCGNYDFLVKNNFNCSHQFPYMAMVRCFLAKILEQEDKVLYLDVDTVVDKNIEKLWHTPFRGNCLVARVEYQEQNYFNSGVLLMNLKQIRGMKTEDIVYRLLSKCRFIFPDQDALNLVYKNLFIPMPHEFNAVGDAVRDGVYKKGFYIRHFAGARKPWSKNPNRLDVQLWEKYKVDRI